MKTRIPEILAVMLLLPALAVLADTTITADPDHPNDPDYFVADQITYHKYTVPDSVRTAATDESLSVDTIGVEVVKVGGIDQNGHITIPSNVGGWHVTMIDSSAFKNNTALRSITVPSTLLQVQDNAFEGCTNLHTFTVDTSAGSPHLMYIADSAFKDCTSLTSFPETPYLILVGHHSFQNSGLTSFSFPDHYTQISSYAFNGCTALASVTFPAELNYIGDYAFEGCTSLTSADLSSTKLGYIQDNAFANCSSLQTVSFPSGTYLSLQTGTFANCTSLTSVDLINTGLTYLPAAFTGCTEITSVSLPSTLTNGIAAGTFADSDKITSVDCAMTTAPHADTDVFAQTVYENAILDYPLDATGYDNQNTAWGQFQRKNIYTAVETLPLEEGRAVYYDLGGTRAERPEAGKIYIMVKGGKASRVISHR